MARVGGTVKWFSNRKGYGFVTPNSGSDDLFVHFSGLKVTEGSFRGLNAGEEVEFKIERDEKQGKDLAVDVTWPDNKPIDRPYRKREDREDGEKPAPRPRANKDGDDKKGAAASGGDEPKKRKRQRRPRGEAGAAKGGDGEGAKDGEQKPRQPREPREHKEVPDLPPIKREGNAIKGTVKWFSYSKGYGFITREDTNEDVFVHRIALYSKLAMPIVVDEQKVEFSLGKDDSGRVIAAHVSAPGGLGLPKHRRFRGRSDRDGKDDE